MHTELPDCILRALQSAIAPELEQALRLERVRHCDRLFGGSGRYQWEFWCHYKGSLKADEPATVQKFRALAVAKGVDADAVLKSLG